MKAVVFYSPGDIRIEDHPDPIPGSDNIILKISCCLICGTDLKVYKSGNPRVKSGQILGHELVGRVVHVGRELSGFSIGDRVTLATTVACGHCETCRLGLGNMCPDAQAIGCGRDGAFAPYLEIPGDAVRGGNLVLANNDCADEVIAVSEPLSCAINAQNIIQVGENDTVVIVGGGPLGAIHAELAKSRGAQVLLADISQSRLELLTRLEQITLVDSSKQDLLETVKARTNGLGADKVIVCAPAAAAMEQSLSLARKGGWVSFFASLPKGSSELRLDSRLIHYNELRVAGSSDSRPEHVEEAVRVLRQGKFNTDAILTHRVSLEDFMEGIQYMEDRVCLKVAVFPEGVGAK